MLKFSDSCLGTRTYALKLFVKLVKDSFEDLKLLCHPRVHAFGT